jgi:hypothetical protein
MREPGANLARISDTFLNLLSQYSDSCLPLFLAVQKKVNVDQSKFAEWTVVHQTLHALTTAEARARANCGVSRENAVDRRLLGGAKEIRNTGPFLGLLLLGDRSKSAYFRERRSDESCRRNSSVWFFWNGRVENLLRHEPSLSIGSPKRTGISNLLCSTKEALLTMRDFTREMGSGRFQ